MKALIISDRQEITDLVTPLLKKSGYDIIHYRWIIKALDNIEEIQPDIIVLSADEYPRHWKTLAGFIESGIGGNSVRLFLSDIKDLSKEDSKKACDLGVEDFSDVFTEKKSIDVEVVLNEEYGAFVFAKGKYFPDEDYAQVALSDSVKDGSFIKYITIFNGEKTSSFSATAEKCKNGFEDFDFRLRIEQYYEKEI